MADPVPLFNSRRSPEEEAGRLRQDAVDSLHRALSGAIDGLRNIPVFLKECFEREAWKYERVFAGGSRQAPIPFHEFVHAPYPVGLGATYETLRGFIGQDVELLAMFDEASRRPVGTNQHSEPVDIVHSLDAEASTFEPAPPAPPIRPSGNAAQAALRRLEKAVRENNERAIELHSDVISGRISPHRAAVNMGWRKEPTPLEIAKRAWTKMTDEERDQFRDWVAGN